MSTSPEHLASIRAEIATQLRDFGSLFGLGTPATPAPGTPTGFGLIQTEFTEGAPTAFLSSSMPRRSRLTDVANNTGAMISAGLAIPVAIGQSWIYRGILYVGGAAVTGGINLRITGPTVTAARLGVFGPRAAGVFQQGVHAYGANSGTYVNFDPAGADALVFVEAYAENFTAAGNLDLQFINVTGGENWIIRRNSWMTGIRTL